MVLAELPLVQRSPRRALGPACAGLALALLNGCAETPMVMRLDPGQPPAAARVWPPPPEVPRYRYVGQLTGEQNFRPADDKAEGGMKRFLRILVGLGADRLAPVVLQRPQCGVVDGEGRIYVTDASRQAVFVFDAAAGKLHVWDLAEGTTSFSVPVGIALGPTGSILVADAGLARVFRFDPTGKPLGSFGKGVLQRPTGVARDPADHLVFVADTRAHDVKVFDDSGRLLRTIGRPGTGAGESNGPTHVAFANGKLYVSDSLNARVLAFTPQGEHVLTLGRRGLFVGNLTRPKGVAVDGYGNVYVVESYYDHLLVFDGEGQFLLPIGGHGTDIGRFYLPSGVWTDRRNRVYVADMFNGRVLILQFLGT